MTRRSLSKNKTNFFKTKLNFREGHFDSFADISILKILRRKNQILCFYYVENDFALGLIIFNKTDLIPLWRTSNPIWETKEKITPLKIIQKNKNIVFYYEYHNNIHSIKFTFEDIFGLNHTNLSEFLQKTSKNPVLKPDDHQHWPVSATFNSGVIGVDDKIHLIYRSVLRSGESVLGHAISDDGIGINHIANMPVYTHTGVAKCVNKSSFFLPQYCSGGSWSGCEDPRLTQIDDKIYMLYTAFDGFSVPSVMLTSIANADFGKTDVLAWNWTSPVQISPPYEMHKNWAVFPEKINGKYAILHSLTPQIQIDYYDSLENDQFTIKSEFIQNNRDEYWDNYIRGIGPPPIKTKDGWLILYHAMDWRDPNKYKLGAMLLDLKTPEKIIYRSTVPILEPKEIYEYEGYKPGIVYSCGGVVKNGSLFIYYGAADTTLCCATRNLDHFLQDIKKSQPPLLKLSLKIQKNKICLKNLI